jgi:hypothetical protein
MAQSVHAAFHFLHDHPSVVEPWLLASNFLVVVQVPDEDALLELITEASRRGLLRSAVREPDLDNEATAVAIEPGSKARRLCAELPLALKNVAAVHHHEDVGCSRSVLHTWWKRIRRIT